MNEAKLKTLVAESAALCALRLTELTCNDWEVSGVELSVEDGRPFEAMMAGLAKDHYGSHFSVPGATFLVLFSGKSGYLTAAAYTREHQDRFENMEHRESKALGEAANIFLNPLIGRLAAAFKRRMIVSAPQMQIASQRDLLTAALERFKDKEALAASVYLKLSSEDLFSECVVVIFLGRELVELIPG